jgi:SdrD B-like protein
VGGSGKDIHFGRRLGAALLTLVAAALIVPTAAQAATFTVQPYDLATGDNLSQFKYVVNKNNAHDPAAADLMEWPSIAPTESNSPVVAVGDEADATVDLPDGKYLISVEAPGHKMWGKHIRLPQNAGVVRIGMRQTPNPLGKIRAFVFSDHHWVNNAFDAGEEGLAGFHVTIYDQIHDQVTVDYFNEPLCGGNCVTGADGFVEIDNLAPGTYFIRVTPPDGTDWVQTSTIEGGFDLQAGVEEGSDGTGAAGEPLGGPLDQQTLYQFGFVHPKDFDSPGNGRITGTALNQLDAPPFFTAITGPPLENPWIALSDTSNDNQVYTAQGDSEGDFTITNVPEGQYMMAIWDEQLTYIIRFLNVRVGSNEMVNLGRVGVSRWTGWLSGDVYDDLNGNGVRDPGESGIANTDLDQRWRDGSIKETTFTDPAGHYEYPEVEGGVMGKFFIGEQGFSRFGTTGASLHDPFDPSQVTPVPSDLGGGLLTNQIVQPSIRSEVDWGKRPYAQGEVGQITGIVFHATTRNELDPRYAAAENYEPGIPDVRVRLEGLGPDGDPNTADDPVLNEYTTDHWSHPTDCDVTDEDGDPITGVNPLIAPNCLEVPILGNETKDGGFDGGYAFADMCPLNPDGTSTFPCDDADKVPLEAGDYVTHVLMPEDANSDPLYQVVREEDVNVDNGEDFVPQIPPPRCVGDPHFVDPDLVVDRSPYGGQTRPLCDKRLVTLANQQNPASDFFIFPKNGMETAGRLIGLVTDDVYADLDPDSIWYGEPRPVGNLPVGIRDYRGRLITTVKTDPNGEFEVLLPSTDTINCPTPQGICPGMYKVIINDPGNRANPNPNWDPRYIGETLAWDVWPGQTTQLDIPVIPNAGQDCLLPAGTPELLQASRAWVGAADTNRNVILTGEGFGTNAGQVKLDDSRAGHDATLTPGNGGIVSWANRRIVIKVPSVNASSFAAGPKHLTIQTATGARTPNGITFHVRGNGYNPPVVQVASPTASPHAIQNAVDAAAPGSLLVLQPGTYHENVILHKRVMLQGLGPGGKVGFLGTGVEPRLNVKGTVIDGRFFQDDRAYWNSKLASLSWDGNQDVPAGADITVIASNGEFTPGLTAPRIDGIGLTAGLGEAAGGIHVNAFGRNLRITNDVLDANKGTIAGGIGLGAPYIGDNQNDDIIISHDRVLRSGAISLAGGVGVFNGADHYSIDHNFICANSSFEYGGGISHYGRSPGSSLTDNQIYYNDSVDSGGGVAIGEEIALNQPALGDGSGNVKVARNLLHSNVSNDDGGGIFVRGAQKAAIDLVNNMIVDNVAGHVGAVMLDDSSNVTLVNNTVANNVSAGTSEGADGDPHSAGLASEPNDPLFQATLPPGAADFSNPRALFNNIFWHNEAFTVDGTTTPPSLVSHGFMDFEIFGATGPRSFRPRYSLLTSNYGPTNQGNIVGQDPGFVDPFTLTLVIGKSQGDPGTYIVEIVTEKDVPPQLDYHINSVSPAVDRGAPFSNFPFPPADASPGPGSILAPSDDYDGQPRPQLRTNRTRIQYDIGADEVPAP